MPKIYTITVVKVRLFVNKTSRFCGLILLAAWPGYAGYVIVLYADSIFNWISARSGQNISTSK